MFPEERYLQKSKKWGVIINSSICLLWYQKKEKKSEKNDNSRASFFEKATKKIGGAQNKIDIAGS